MQKIGRSFAPLAFFAASLAAGVMSAQTVTIGPTGYLTIGPGGKQQFTAMVSGTTGDMSTTVTWLAGGKIGGSATAGTIDSTGLYTAPMTAPSTGQVQITAKAAGKSASTYIYQLAAGPTITSVSPNPIPVGSDTLTVTGAGCQSGAFVWVGAVRYGSVFVNAQTLKVAIYQG